MADEEQDVWSVLTSHVGKKVLLDVKERDEEQIEGWIEAIGKNGVLLKRKKNSTGSAELLFPFEITGVQLLEIAEQIKQTELKPVTVKNVRKHLISHHGWYLSQVNKITDDEALEAHTALHDLEVAFDYGHHHHTGVE